MSGVGAASLEAFGEYCEDHGKPKVQVSQYPTGAAVLLALFSGRIDFGPTTPSIRHEGISVHAQFSDD